METGFGPKNHGANLCGKYGVTTAVQHRWKITVKSLASGKAPEIKQPFTRSVEILTGLVGSKNCRKRMKQQNMAGKFIAGPGGDGSFLPKQIAGTGR